MKKEIIINAEEFLDQNNYKDFQEIVNKQFEFYKNKDNVNFKNMLAFWYSKEWKDWCMNNMEFIKRVNTILHKEILDAYKNIIMKIEGYEKNIIPAFGTLLGIVRSKTLIPWDDDADFLIDINFYSNNFEKISKAAEDHGWFIKRKSYFSKGFKPNFKNSAFFDQIVSKNFIYIMIGEFKLEIRPNIDLFYSTAIRKLNDKENKRYGNLATKALFDYYLARGLDCEFELKIIENVSKRKIDWYHNEDFKKEKSLRKTEKALSKLLKKYYSKDSGLTKIFSLCGSSKFEKNLYYLENNTIPVTIKNDGEEYEFYIPPNSEECLNSWYGDWKEEKLSHSHMITPWNIKRN